MLDLKALYTKIEYLRTEIVPDSISPMRLGAILREMLDQIKETYLQCSGEDLSDLFDEADITLEKAKAALDTLTVAIERLEQALHITIVDRGIYDPSATYYFEALNPATSILETSDVWYCGCRYRCLVTGTAQTPGYKSTDWLFMEGIPDFTVDFAETDYLFDPDNFDVTLTVIARLHNIDITQDISDTDVVWSRYSEDALGAPRVASDSVWALKRAGAGKSLHLTAADMDFNGYMPKTIKITAAVTLRDSMGNTAAEEQAIFEY